MILCKPAASSVTREPELGDPGGYSEVCALRVIVEFDRGSLLAVVDDCKELVIVRLVLRLRRRKCDQLVSVMCFTSAAYFRAKS